MGYRQISRHIYIERERRMFQWFIHAASQYTVAYLGARDENL